MNILRVDFDYDNYDPEKLPEALMSIWEHMTEEQQYEFLKGDSINDTMKAEMSEEWYSE